jgi:Domain of unknown function (DUF4919)
LNSRKFSHLLFSSLALAVLVVLPVASAYSQTAQAPAPAPASTDSYDEMVKKVESGDLSVNFAELRMKYAASAQYEPEEGSDELKDMYGKLNARDFKGALATANRVLAKQYVNINAHIVASAAYDGLHDDAAAKLHHDIVVGLVRSILDSGAGTNIETAYKVISVQEEYAVMRVLGLRPGSQSYLQNGKKTYDKMEMVNMKDNSTVTRYFDVTLSDQNMEKSLQH